MIGCKCCGCCWYDYYVCLFEIYGGCLVSYVVVLCDVGDYVVWLGVCGSGCGSLWCVWCDELECEVGCGG